MEKEDTKKEGRKRRKDRRKKKQLKDREERKEGKQDGKRAAGRVREEEEKGEARGMHILFFVLVRFLFINSCLACLRTVAVPRRVVFCGGPSFDADVLLRKCLPWWRFGYNSARVFCSALLVSLILSIVVLVITFV